MKPEPKLGDFAKDIITGFEGTISGKADYLTGCTQVCLLPPVDKDGKLRDGNWFDIERVEVLTHVKPAQINVRPTGGPSNAAETAPVR